jgi:hypothetical protein
MGEFYRSSLRAETFWFGDRTSDIGITTHTGVPSSGTTGFGAGILGKGSLCINKASGVLYINTNTKASPTWVEVGISS